MHKLLATPRIDHLSACQLLNAVAPRLLTRSPCNTTCTKQ
jgi:hypothetical protein